MNTIKPAKGKPLSVAEATALFGADALSDHQLLETLFAKDSPVEPLDLLAQVGTLQALIALGPMELRALGVSPEDAARLEVCGELQRRSTRTLGARLANPRLAGAYLLPKAAGLSAERFGILCLNAKHEVIADRILSQGTATGTLISPREFYREALRQGAVTVIAWHNHPSGDPTPSREDRELTRRFRLVGDYLGIFFADHIVLGSDTWCSMRTEEGWDRDVEMAFAAPAEGEPQS